MQSLTQSVGKTPAIIRKLVDHWLGICILSQLASLIYIVVIITPNYNEPTRISENAMLPALVNERFSHGSKIDAFAKALRKNNEFAIYVKSRLEEHGIPAQLQSFNVSLPHFKHSGTNVIGIVRASRSASVESMIVAAAIDRNHVEPAAVCLALATHSREQIYWARDLIFVFVDMGTIGMEAFLAAYHGRSKEYIQYEELRYRSGSVVGGFALKTTGSSFTHLDIEFNMVNGQLPNLDLVNLMVKLGEKQGMTPTVFNHGSQATWHEIADTVLQGLITQGFVNDQGIHSVFGKYGIQAVTIHAKNMHDSRRSFNEVAYICEGALRSLNNILEKFHQSYFLYVLPNSKRFISVANYMPAIGLILLPLLVLALRDWFSMPNLAVSYSYVIFHLIGCASYVLVILLVKSMSFCYGMHLSALLWIIPYYFIFPIKSHNCAPNRFLFHLEFGLVLITVSLINFSLALIISLVAVPVIFIFSCFRSKTFNRLKAIFGFLVHPVSLAILCRIKYFGSVEMGFNGLEKIADKLVEDHLLYDAFLFPFIHIFLVPLWNIFIQFSSADVY